MERDSITLADLLGLGEPDLPPSKKCKKKKKVDRFYSEEHVQMALFEVENGISSLRRAAIKFNVPRSTLVFRRSPKFTKVEKGPRPILSREEEDELASWILQGEKYGAPRKYVHIQNWVQKLLNDHPRDNVPFQDNKPGRGWMKNFMKRHPELNAMRSISFEDHCETVRTLFKVD
ncbi:hypothetical protein GE061_004848 [Apolygus lucorum]|uniref:HTH CENPB-type domain-containing protein n=1 Tax=Apolygus lucorum TaxID=248454 RepID=A0A8S9X254_APOLU|nr:hypothetical protein GE061_004848 [Apolygus lucorum]